MQGHLSFKLLSAVAFIVVSMDAQARDVVVKPPAEYAQSGKIKFCTTSTNPPREFDLDGKPVGTDVDLARDMAGLMGLDVEWVELKFASLVPALQASRCDMIVEELYITPAREKIIDMLPFSTSAEQLIVPPDNVATIHSLDDLSGKKVGVPTGTTFQKILEEMNAKLEAAGKAPVTILALPGTQDVFNQIMAKTVDAGGVTTTSAAYYLQKSEGKVKVAGVPFHEIKDGFGMRKDSKQLYEAMAQALEHLRKDGTYHKIFEKYALVSAELPM
jgi:polar amino acid transport system substrate-binding protein